MNRFDSAATLSDRNDTRITRNQTRKTALMWVKLLGIAGVAAIVSGIVDGGISMWIVAAFCVAASAIIGIVNWS
jgi:hypothetical protein